MRYFLTILATILAAAASCAEASSNCDKGKNMGNNMREVQCNDLDGNLKEIEVYENDQLIKSTSYNSKKQVVSVSHYKDGEKHGLTEVYLDFADNPRRETYNYVNGKKSGLQTRYHPDGITVFAREYIDAKTDSSTLINFNTSGNPTDVRCGENFPAEFAKYCTSPVQLYTNNNEKGRMLVPNNIAFTGSTADSEGEISYKDGQLHGPRKIYDDKGNLTEIKNYINGNIAGEQKNYFPNSTQLREVYDVHPTSGKYTKHILYWQNGSLQTSKEYLEEDVYVMQKYNDKGQLTFEGKFKDSGKCGGTWCRDIPISPLRRLVGGFWYVEHYDNENNLAKTVKTDLSGKELEVKEFYPDGSTKF